MTRQEHLDWCKRRALEYVERGELSEAVTSMCSDLTKHDETANHKGIDIAMGLLLAGSLRTKPEVDKFIKGFN